MTRVVAAGRDDFHRAMERLFGDGSAVGLTDAELLERFAAGGDEAAFEALVERYGPVVLGVCRRLLRDPNDVDDAFQAVFLVLVRKAGSLRRGDLLGAWLFGVARKVALRARSLAAVREARAGSTADGEALGVDARRSPSPNPADALDSDEENARLHEEVERLPRRYRAPVVACYFEGRTHEEAAKLLGCPLGTVKGRLARARDLLRKRLERRGVEVSPVVLAGRLSAPELRPPVPATLVSSTTRSALMTAESLPISIQVLAKGALKAMTLARAKAVAFPLTLVAAGLVAAGGTVAAYQGEGKKAEPQEKPPAEVRPEKNAEADKSENEKPEDSRGMADEAPPRPGRPGFQGRPDVPDRPWVQQTDGPSPEEQRVEIARLAATVAKNDENPNTKAVMDALDQPLTFRTTEESTLRDILKQIKESLTTADGKKVPIYVDPNGLKDAEVVLESSIQIDLEDVPVKFSLRLMLKQLRLAYCVRDGVVIISSLKGVLQELKEAESELMGLHPDKVIIGPSGPALMGGMGRPGGMR